MSDQSHALSILILLYKKNRISCARSRQPPISQASLKSVSRSCPSRPSASSLSQQISSTPSTTKNSRPKWLESSERRRRFAATISLLTWCAARSICSPDQVFFNAAKNVPGCAPSSPRTPRPSPTLNTDQSYLICVITYYWSEHVSFHWSEHMCTERCHVSRSAQHVLCHYSFECDKLIRILIWQTTDHNDGFLIGWSLATPCISRCSHEIYTDFLVFERDFIDQTDMTFLRFRKWFRWIFCRWPILHLYDPLLRDQIVKSRIKVR